MRHARNQKIDFRCPGRHCRVAHGCGWGATIAADWELQAARVASQEMNGGVGLSGKGSNSVKVRHYNERFVLDAIRRLKEASKSDLARAANLTPAAVATIVDGLESSGFVKQVGKRF